MFVRPTLDKVLEVMTNFSALEIDSAGAPRKRHILLASVHVTRALIRYCLSLDSIKERRLIQSGERAS